jgi:5-methylcytosine-specific restriction endonuclease McrA
MLTRKKLEQLGYCKKSIDEYFDYHKRNAKTKTIKFRKPKPSKRPNNKYQKYLLSKEWAEVKIALYESRGKRCEVCSSQKAIQVHHLTYKNIFKEEPEDLMILCRPCHEAVHRKS